MAVDCSYRTVSFPEPSASRHGNVRWLLRHLRELRRSGRQAPSDGPLLIAWPVLGYWDFIAVRILTRRPTWIVVHDPTPLVAARGYGKLARWAASRRCVRSRAIVHSETARAALRTQADVRSVALLPHPMHEPFLVRPRPAHVTISVLGQYKADRDVEGLERLAATCPPDWDLRISGRRWPTVPGWTVASEFLSEGAFAEAVARSSVVLIPYARFFQSGVALRALEAGRPVVGPAASSLAEVLGSDCKWLVEDGEWLAAVLHAVQSSDEDILRRAQAAHRHLLTEWCRWLKPEADAL